MVEVAAVLHATPAGELHDQFVGWLPQPTRWRAAPTSAAIPT
jgi:hypothetical protein